MPSRPRPFRPRPLAPKREGLYDPSFESDACGVGFVAHLDGRKSHATVQSGVQLLKNLQHRGACGCEVNTGDGAGILIQTPDRFLRKVAPASLPAVGQYGAGLIWYSWLPGLGYVRALCRPHRGA